MNDEWSDLAIANGIALMLQVFLCLLAFFLVVAVIKFVIDWTDAHRPLPRREVRRVERNARGRKAMATDIRPRYAQVSALDWDDLEQRASKTEGRS
jgi:hypothetical protein